jgi:hypothetical protein
VELFVINDNGAWMLKRAQDYSRAEIAELALAAREHELVDLYERAAFASPTAAQTCRGSCRS